LVCASIFFMGVQYTKELTLFMCAWSKCVCRRIHARHANAGTRSQLSKKEHRYTLLSSTLLFVLSLLQVGLGPVLLLWFRQDSSRFSRAILTAHQNTTALRSSLSPDTPRVLTIFWHSRNHTKHLLSSQQSKVTTYPKKQKSITM